MEIIYLLIPLSLLLLCVAILGFFWAVKSGQFDDLESPALMILGSDKNEQSNENSIDKIESDCSK